MKKIMMALGVAAVATTFSMTAQAGDAAKGEQIAKTRCAACHTFDDGGANRVGPNLWGSIGDGPGTVTGFNYSPDYTAAAGTGFQWTDENLQHYLEDPTVFLREVTGNGSARSRMTFKLPSETDRTDVIAYLKTLQ